MKLFLAFTTMMVLTACASNDVPKQSKSSRAEAQAECAKHFASVSDDFSRANKIKACMRARGAL